MIGSNQRQEGFLEVHLGREDSYQGIASAMPRTTRDSDGFSRSSIPAKSQRLNRVYGSLRCGRPEQAAEKLDFGPDGVSRRLKPLLILQHLRRGLKPRPFKTGVETEFFAACEGMP
jgi:hypothetical protein